MGVSSTLTLLFEDPFWIGLYERTDGGAYEVCKITFGAEPKDCEVYDFLLQHWHSLAFSPPVEAGKAADKKPGHKRMQREIARGLARTGTGTKAQQAVSLMREEAARERKVNAKARAEEEKAQRYALRQQKKKEKHRGR